MVTNDDLAELADVVLRIAREVDPHAAQLPDVVPLTGTGVLVMRWVNRHPGVTPSAVAEATALQRSNTSVAVRALVTKNMIERRPRPDDARTVELFPTDLAVRSITRLHAHWADALRRALGDDDRGVHAAASLLTRVDKGLRSLAR